ncbi:MAG: YceI family protein [Vibrio sp.]
MKKWMTTTGLVMAMSLPMAVNAADYQIDTKGQHASVNFKVSHLGYSYTVGRFNDFSGTFSYDPADIEASKVNVEVDITSLDSNHAERDKHIRSDDFLDASKFPKATFSSTKVVDKGDGAFEITGDLTLMDKTVPMTIDAALIGAGEDPWGGERAGFEGTARINFSDFGIKESAGASYADLDLYVEGVKQ